MSSLVQDLRFRGLLVGVTDEAVLDRLDHGHVVAYIGFDPTGEGLHVGSLLQLCTLRRLQLAGHQPIALAGGGTGRIGDPGGKVSERTLLDDDELARNLAAIEVDLGRFLDFDASAGDRQAALLDNGDWLGRLGAIELLRDVGKHFTVNQMVAKESVRARFERPDQGITFTEFSYMLLQAYDFYRLHLDHGCDLQMGGSDQWGNITLGVELIHKRCPGHDAYGITTPLVLKADGTKFGKSESGTVWLNAERTSPYRFFQFFLQSEDEVVGHYLRYFTFLSHADIAALDYETAEHPERRAAQRALARAVTALVHGDAEAAAAERAAQALFGGDLATLDERTLLEVFDEVPSSTLARSRLEAASDHAGDTDGPGDTDGTGASGRPLVVDLLAEIGLVASKSEARRAVTQGGITLNGAKVDDIERTLATADLLHDRYAVLRKGRRSYHLLRVE